MSAALKQEECKKISKKKKKRRFERRFVNKVRIDCNGAKVKEQHRNNARSEAHRVALVQGDGAGGEAVDAPGVRARLVAVAADLAGALRRQREHAALSARRQVLAHRHCHQRCQAHHKQLLLVLLHRLNLQVNLHLQLLLDPRSPLFCNFTPIHTLSMVPRSFRRGGLGAPKPSASDGSAPTTDSNEGKAMSFVKGGNL